MKTYISIGTYVQIMEQAVHNDGRVVLETIGHSPFEALVDVEYAKKEWSKFEKIVDQFNNIPN